MELIMQLVVPVSGIIALLTALIFAFRVNHTNPGNETMVGIADSIRTGAKAFLRREYSVLVFFIIGITILLSIALSPWTGLVYVIGAVTSALTGYIGMMMATAANVRVANVVEGSIKKALRVAFEGGAVLGMSVVGIGLTGLSVTYFLLNYFGEGVFDPITIIAGYGFGASSIALFARVGGGIYTKSADVGADLVGKVEQSIPEDDPRNPATIADNVGDNVGDIAGMGADLYESYVSTLVGAMTIGAIIFGFTGILLGLVIAAVGIIGGILGTFFVSAKETPEMDFTQKTKQAMGALRRGTLASFFITIAAVFLICYFFPLGNMVSNPYESDRTAVSKEINQLMVASTYESYETSQTKIERIVRSLPVKSETNRQALLNEFNNLTIQIANRDGSEYQGIFTSINEDRIGQIVGMHANPEQVKRLVSDVAALELRDTLNPWTSNNIAIFLSVLLGLIAGLVIGYITEYYTSDSYRYVKRIAKSSQTGAATNIITGLSVGLYSTAIPVLVTAIAIIGSYTLAGTFGIPMAAVGILATMGYLLSIDGYGPITDNAAGIAEMAGLGEEARTRAEALDSVGNTTAAINKGFAISAAAFTAFALFLAYQKSTGLETISITDPWVIAGLFVGGMLPFFFSALTISAVGKGAEEMVHEVRRQFKEIDGLMEGKAKADYARCVDISTRSALFQMIIPGGLAILAPIVVGFLMGPAALGGLLAGAIVSGFLMAIFMANVGGAWDNAKKYIEGGNFGGKRSPAHKAAVVGDTVGDPLKDTSGPSLNILIKLMSIIGLIIAPLIMEFWG